MYFRIRIRKKILEFERESESEKLRRNRRFGFGGTESSWGCACLRLKGGFEAEMEKPCLVPPDGI